MVRIFVMAAERVSKTAYLILPNAVSSSKPKQKCGINAKNNNQGSDSLKDAVTNLMAVIKLNLNSLMEIEKSINK